MTSDIGSPAKVKVDAILAPRMVSAERTRPMYIFQEQTTTIILEWMMKDVNGDLIWVDTITGEGKAPMGGPFGEKKNARKQVERALEELFQKSFETMSSSVEIRGFAATH